MRRTIIAVVFCAFFIPLAVSAQEPITRRDGFMLMWQSIKRPAEPIKTVFNDVPEEAYGSLEIDYAASRNIISDEEDAFRPDEPLVLQDALIWLFRTRNVLDDPKDVNPETMSGLLLRFPIAHVPDDGGVQTPVSEEELLTLMRLLDTQLMEEDHEVSLYSEKFHGKGTAFGESFDMYALTAAHRSFPHNTLVKVTNIENGKSVIVRINDRGPYVSGRDMDLSLGSFTTIAERSRGKIRATFQRLGDARLVGLCAGNSPRQQRISRDVILESGVPHQFMLGETLTLSSSKAFVIRGIRYPDGFETRLQDFILKDENFSLKPSVEGEYVLSLGTIDGKSREMTMNVVKCGE